MTPVSSKQSSEFQFDLTGGQLALDLANSVSRRDDPARRNDHLPGFGEILAFVRQTKVLTPKQAHELAAYAGAHAAEARRTFQKIVTLREAVFRAVAPIAQGKHAPVDDLQVIGDYAREAMQHRVLAPGNGGYCWHWSGDGKHPLDRVLWPMAQAAADLLTSEDLRKVRLCGAPDCDWLFLDHSRNASRRWCDMTTCGNRAKARRHYRRVHR
jgi:predicted RNA-binding Zn ribbon-like protein